MPFKRAFVPFLSTYRLFRLQNGWNQTAQQSSALNGGEFAGMDLLSCLASAACPQSSSRQPKEPPYMELIITSQPLPSLITHILKLVEQSILHWMQIAVAEELPQPLKVLPFSVFVLKKYRPPPPAQQVCAQSILGITTLNQATALHWCMHELNTHTHTRGWVKLVFGDHFIRAGRTLLLSHLKHELRCNESAEALIPSNTPRLLTASRWLQSSCGSFGVSMFMLARLWATDTEMCVSSQSYQIKIYLCSRELICFWFGFVCFFSISFILNLQCLGLAWVRPVKEPQLCLFFSKPLAWTCFPSVAKMT